jgi:hypothetical protein
MLYVKECHIAYLHADRDNIINTKVWNVEAFDIPSGQFHSIFFDRLFFCFYLI